MEIIAGGKKTILNPAVTILNETIVSQIEKQISQYSQDTQLVINLEQTEVCVNKFFSMLSKLKHYNISLVNVDSRILSAIYMMKFDKYVKIFGDDVSLYEDSNELINRRFSVVK